MRAGLRGIVVALMLSACGGTGPIFPVDDQLYDWVTTRDAVDPASDQDPQIAGEVVAFRLAPGQRRSALRAGAEWRLGQTYLFGFDVKADPRRLGAEALTLSRLIRAGGSGPADIVRVSVDARRGVTVMGRRCIAPEDLTDWQRVEMRIRLSNSDTGFLEVFCNRKPIWAVSNMRTTFAPVCRASEGCTTDVGKPVRYEWQMGLISDRRVRRPVLAQMRRLHYRLLLYIPNRPGNL